MTDSPVERCAELLREAARTRTPIEPLTRQFPGHLDVDAAWRIQTVNRNLLLDSGRQLRGYKVGLTSEAMQRQMGVGEPDFGVLLDDMVLRDGSSMSLRDFVAPRAEAEVALVVDRDLGEGVSAQDILVSLSGAYPALEIIDSRIRDWQLTLVDTVADNASSGAYVLGPAMDIKGTDLADLQVRMLVNGDEVDSGLGAAALGHPANAAAWLANRLAGFGLVLAAGSVVLTGSLHASIPLHAADHVVADFGRHGRVQLDVVD